MFHKPFHKQKYFITKKPVWVFLFLLIFHSLNVGAYIPSSEMVLSRLDKNSGSGSYLISQEVIFTETSKFQPPLRLVETWWRGPGSNLF